MLVRNIILWLIVVAGVIAFGVAVWTGEWRFLFVTVLCFVLMRKTVGV